MTLIYESGIDIVKV